MVVQITSENFASIDGSTIPFIDWDTDVCLDQFVHTSAHIVPSAAAALSDSADMPCVAASHLYITKQDAKYTLISTDVYPDSSTAKLAPSNRKQAAPCMEIDTAGGIGGGRLVPKRGLSAETGPRVQSLSKSGLYSQAEY